MTVVPAPLRRTVLFLAFAAPLVSGAAQGRTRITIKKKDPRTTSSFVEDKFDSGLALAQRRSSIKHLIASTRTAAGFERFKKGVWALFESDLKKVGVVVDATFKQQVEKDLGQDFQTAYQSATVDASMKLAAKLEQYVKANQKAKD